MKTSKLSEWVAPVFRPVHRAAKRQKYTQYWLRGGRASGKSSFVSLEIVQGLMRRPGAHAICFRKVAATLRDSVVAQMRWAIRALGAEAHWHYQKSPLELIYRPTGQRILFSGMDDAEKVKGIKLEEGYFGYIWLEELTEFSGMGEVESALRSLVRGRRHCHVFCSYNPPIHAGHWVNLEAARPVAGRMVHSSCYLDLPKEWLGDQFLAEAERLREQDERRYRWAYLGEAVGSGGTVFGNVVTRPIADSEMQTLDRRYDGLDFGYTVDPSAYVVCAYRAEKKALYIVDEYYATGASYDRLAAEINSRNPGRRVVVADSSEPRSMDELAVRGVRMAGAVKGPGSVEHGIKWLQDLRQIVVDPQRTPQTARECMGYEYAADGRGGFLARYPDRDNHSIDAVRYAMESEMRSGGSGFVRLR